MGHGKVWKSGTAMMPGFGATRKKGAAVPDPDDRRIRVIAVLG